MKKIHVTRRANAVTRNDMQNFMAMKREFEKQANMRMGRDNKARKFAVKRCQCGKRHWGRKDKFLSAKQAEVARLCPDCFFDKYDKRRPWWFRFLTKPKEEALLRYYEATGVKISHIDDQ